MIQTVIKRDGRIVGYNEEKIKAAIRKAMLTTDLGEDETLIQKIADRIGVTGGEGLGQLGKGGAEFVFHKLRGAEVYAYVVEVDIGGQYRPVGGKDVAAPGLYGVDAR